MDLKMIHMPGDPETFIDHLVSEHGIGTRGVEGLEDDMDGLDALHSDAHDDGTEWDAVPHFH